MIVSSYSFIDASTGDYQEEEVFYQEEEEEHFDHLTNPGKLIFLQARLMQADKLANHHGAKLYQSKASLHFTSWTYPKVFTLQALLDFIYQSYFLIYDSLGLG